MLKYKLFMLLAALVILVSCGGQDQQALNAYFKAVVSGDNAALAAVAAVEFPEKVQSWEILEIGSESAAPFQLKDLTRKKREAEIDMKYIAEKDYLFLSDNQHHYRRYKAQLEKDPDAEFEGELADFHQEFVEIREKAKESEKILETANREFEREKLTAGISLMGSTVTTELDGEVLTKEAKVKVTTSTGDKSYQITLKNYSLVNPQSQSKARSRWIITDVAEI
jgi:hypothetical protein